MTTMGHKEIPIGIHSVDEARDAIRKLKFELEKLEAYLASTTNTQGASMIGVENASSHYAGADLETILDEIAARSKAIDGAW